MYPFVKLCIDVIIAGTWIVLLSPLLVLVAIAIRMRMGRPVVFKQMRPGLYSEPFFMYKFRTMTDEIDEKGELLPDEMRLTELGRFLRSSSMDELPELFNVLKGDMSLVGPRPLLIQYLDRYTAEQARRHEVKPGITGWAQINGRNAITWEEKFALDVWYVDNRSIWLDIKILFMTLAKVIKREGINADGEATMSEFVGTVSNCNPVQGIEANDEAAASQD